MNDLLASLRQALARGDFAALENLWLELLEVRPIPAEALAGLLTQLIEQGEGARALDLALALAPDLVHGQRHAEALPLLRAVAPAAPGHEEVRNLLIESYRAVHAQRPHLEACLHRAALLTETDLGRAVATLDALLAYRKGETFYHPAGWGVGRITDFDPVTAAARIDFEHKRGHLVPLESLDSLLERLEPDDFRVLRLTDPDRLRRMAAEEPLALVHQVLEANGGRLTQRALRETLVPDLVPAGEWSKWWTRTRAALTRDPRVGLGRGSNPILTLREEALTYEEEMRARFARLRDLAHKTALLREYLAHRARDASPDAFLLPAARDVAEAIAHERSPGAAFEAAVLLEALAGDVKPPASAEDLLDRQPDPLLLLRELATPEGRRRALEHLRQRAEDWPALCRRILLEGPPALWDAALAELPPQGEPPSRASVVQEVLEAPGRHRRLFAWMARHLLAGKWDLGVDLAGVFDRLLAEGDELARRKAEQKSVRARYRPARFEHEDALAELRQALRTGGLDYFDAIAEGTGEAEAGRLLLRIRQSRILTTAMARSLEKRLLRRHPQLLVEEAAPAAAEPELLYATPEGIERRRRDYERLVNVLIPENAKAIGRAAALGDVSDNADFRAATQERDRLNALRRQMTEELHRARPIEPRMVRTDRVSIGTRVTVENVETGERRTYTLLGPWDADPERGVIAYSAPLAQALLRHQVGEEATFQHAGQSAAYRILAIENALEGGPE